jgi:hypothetical protein
MALTLPSHSRLTPESHAPLWIRAPTRCDCDSPGLPQGEHLSLVLMSCGLRVVGFGGYRRGHGLTRAGVGAESGAGRDCADGATGLILLPVYEILRALGVAGLGSLVMLGRRGGDVWVGRRGPLVRVS